MLTLRLGMATQTNYEFVDKLISVIRANPGSCDEVWLTTMYGFPTLEKHRQTAEALVKTAGKFRDAGIRVSMQLANSIGHGMYMSARDCSGLVYDHSPVRKMVGPDGTTSEYCFCWNGDIFRQYVLEEVYNYVSIVKPHTLWVDDDFRPANHAPVQYGCFCDECVKRYNEVFGSCFDRDGLVRAINTGDKKWRIRHVEMIREDFHKLAFDISAQVKRAYPDCRMGLQMGMSNYSGFGSAHILDAMYEATGIPPAYRAGGGNYCDYNPADTIIKGDEIALQHYALPDYVVDRRPEIENLPHVAYGKSIGGTAFETTYYLAIGSNAMSYSMAANENEPLSWHNGEFESFSKHKEYWKRLADNNTDSEQGGFQYVISKTQYLEDTEVPFGYAEIPGIYESKLRFVNIPVAYTDQAGFASILHPDMAKTLTDEEIRVLMEKPVITDGKTIRILQSRGYDIGVSVEKTDIMAKQELLSDHEINGDACGKTWEGPWGKDFGWAITACPAGSHILSWLISTKEESWQSEKLPCSAVIPMNNGAKWALFGFDFWGRTIPTFKRDQLIRAGEYISGKPCPARLVTALQAIVLPRVSSEGRLVSCSITNCTIADSGTLELIVASPVSDTAVFMSQYQEKTEIRSAKLENGLYRIIIPNIRPWSVGTLFFR